MNIKKILPRSIIAIIALIGLVLTLILLSNGPVETPLIERAEEFVSDVAMSDFLGLLAVALFLTSIVMYCILGLFEKTNKIKNYTVAVLAGITLVVLIVSIVYGLDYSNFAQSVINDGRRGIENALGVGTPQEALQSTIDALDVAQFTLTSARFEAFVNIIIFALLPLVYATKNILEEKFS